MVECLAYCLDKELWRALEYLNALKMNPELIWDDAADRHRPRQEHRMGGL